MSTIFVGGSRRVSRLPGEVTRRLAEIVGKGDRVIVGDANGADKAVQRFFLDAKYENVKVFCAGEHPRNNLRPWETEHIYPDRNLKGFHFYAEKDRAMARAADIGLMIWDGKSPGTALNVLRLIRAGKQAVLLNALEGEVMSFDSTTDWESFVAQRTDEFRIALRQRATLEEWSPSQPADTMEAQTVEQPSLF